MIREQLITASSSSVNPINPAGRLLWVARVDGSEHRVETKSGSYDALPPFVRALDEAVSQDVAPAQRLKKM